jgi:hypothetical protein
LVVLAFLDEGAIPAYADRVKSQANSARSASTAPPLTEFPLDSASRRCARSFLGHRGWSTHRHRRRCPMYIGNGTGNSNRALQSLEAPGRPLGQQHHHMHQRRAIIDLKRSALRGLGRCLVWDPPPLISRARCRGLHRCTGVPPPASAGWHSC